MMSIKTNNLTEILLTQDIPAALQEVFTQLSAAMAVDKLGNGLINKTWRVHCPDRSYILQRINDQVFRDPFIIENNLKKIAAYLGLYYPDYYLPLPLAATDGKTMLYKSGTGYFRLFDFLEGSVCNTIISNTKQAYEAARQFGGFTRRLSGLPVEQLGEPIPDFHNLKLRYQQFEKAVPQASPERLQKASLLVDFIKEHAYIFEQYNYLRKNGSMILRPMHHDTKISNILFDVRDKGMAVIDLDTVMPGYFISDLGDMIRTFTCTANEEETDFNKVTIRKDFFEAIVNGYLLEMKDILTASERSLLVYAGECMIYMQCLRFATDYLENDRYYGAKYPGQNLNRALNQMKLLQELIKAKPVLEKIIADVFYRIK